jgi:hypothetical protein
MQGPILNADRTVHSVGHMTSERSSHRPNAENAENGSRQSQPDQDRERGHEEGKPSEQVRIPTAEDLHGPAAEHD